jgi:hypothetical protein
MVFETGTLVWKMKTTASKPETAVKDSKKALSAAQIIASQV